MDKLNCLGMKEADELQHRDLIEGLIERLFGPRSEGEFRQINSKKVKEFVDVNRPILKKVLVGLGEDWTYSNGVVWDSGWGYAVDSDAYCASCWATPVLQAVLEDGSEVVLECWELGKNPDFVIP